MPSSGQSATIASPHAVQLTANQTVGSLNVNVGATLMLGSSTLSINAVNGTLTVAGILAAGTGTVNFAAPGAQCVQPATFHNVQLSGSGTKTLCGNVTVNGNINISTGVTLNTDGGAN